MKVFYQGVQYETRDGETLLKMFLRQGVKVPYSCGGGSCHTCLHRCIEGELPEKAQRGLREIYKQHNYFMICRCVPTGDMHIDLPDAAERYIQANIEAVNGPNLTLYPFNEISASRGQVYALYQGAQLLGRGEITADSALGEPIALRADTSVDLHALAVNDTIELQGPMAQTQASVVMAEGLNREFPEPDLALWEELDNGQKLIPLLREFYHRVFRDPLLAPYFAAVTESRLVEKQFNFLHQAITGEKIYWGERPRNAHHWMVISDEIFDHRAAILEQVLIEQQFSETAIAKLVAIEERYRQDIVKAKPWDKVLFGKAIPVDGYESLVLDEASLCDNCNREVRSSERVIYHVRTGKIFCKHCNQSTQ